MAAYASRPAYGLFSALPDSDRSSWSSSNGHSQGVPRPRSLPHIKDIQAAAAPEVSRDESPRLLLQRAEEYIKSSQRASHGDFKRPDIAYKDYLRGSEVALNYIPGHREYGFASDNMPGWKERYKQLRRVVKEMDQQMADLKLAIQEDNARSGVRPNSVSNGAGQKVYATEFGMPVAESDKTRGDARPSSANGLPSSLQVGRQRPVVPSKPEGLYSSSSVDANNELSQRFARLRMPANGLDHGQQLKMPKVEDYQNGGTSTTGSQFSLGNGYPQSRPNGPREMYPASNGPSLPPKLPLSTAGLYMPKPPSPTYSPSKVSPAAIQPGQHRPSAEQGRPNIEKRPTYYNQPIAPAQVQRTRDENPYRPRTPNGSAIIAKNSSSEIPLDSSVKPERLLEYMKNYNVLIIDVRERQLFDEGHIFHGSILCIEPVALKEGVSAEELEERLVVSPENESRLFERRNEFDVVVYYDQHTDNTKYLSGAPTGSKTPALRALYDTLYEFNHYKPLKDGRPPALLLGGLDAWVDLMSSNSLATSRTAAHLGSTPRRPASHAVRRRMVSANSALEVRKRRMREYRPLDADEEQAWRTQAQEEEVGQNEYAQGSSDSDQIEGEESEAISPIVHDYESFLRKFPEVGGQQSMTMPTRAAPQSTRYQQPSIPPIPSRPAPTIPRPSYSGQADINQSQASLARVTSATRPPLYTSYSVSRRMKLPRTGLTNFGVTCYMNSTLQCLSATTSLTSFFLEDRYKDFVQKNWKGSSGIMPDLYTNVIRSLWKQDVEVIKPSTFRNFCGRMNREWVIDRQQDAKEFFDFLIDCLHEDLNVNWNRNPLRPLRTDEELQRERMHVAAASPVEWQRFQHRDYSYISSLFAGQHASRLRCRTCGNTSTTYEAFYSISIEIPQEGRGNIYDCLRHYTKEEMLSGDEVWKCPHCKCEREATKQIILTRLPQVLVVHFKRFSASRTESARKIHTPIDFPVYGLRMDDFVIAKPVDMAGKQQLENDGKIDPATTAPFSYDCYGVLRHLGNTGNGGHYVSLVRDQGRGDAWYKFDDENAREVDVRPGGREKLQNGEAYIVFYQRAAAR